MRWNERFGSIVYYIVKLLLAGMFIILTVNSFLCSWVNTEDLRRERPVPAADNLVMNLLGLIGMLAFMVLLFIAVKWLEKHYPKYASHLSALCLVITALGSFIFSVYWVGAASSVPISDQEDIARYAYLFNKGDFSPLQKGEYMAQNPQQLGLVTILRVLYAFFGNGNFYAYQYLNACMIPVIVISGFMIVRMLIRAEQSDQADAAAGSTQHAAEIIYLLLIGTCIPMYLYVPFVYGEITSTALLMACAAFILWTLQLRERRSWLTGLQYAGVLITCFLALLARENASIMVIGFLCVLLLQLIIRPEKKTCALLMTLLLAFILKAVLLNALYAPHTPKDAKGMPAMLYIAMGTNEKNGWWDNYNRETFAACGFEPEAAIEASKETVRIFADKCLKDPGFAYDYYKTKLNSQWCTPEYQGLTMTRAIQGRQTPFAKAVYNNSYKAIIDNYMNLLQLTVYSLITAGLILGLLPFRKKGSRRQNNVISLILLVGIYGGFLFSLIWEAKARYTLPYFILMLPMAAVSAGVGNDRCMVCSSGKAGEQSHDDSFGRNSKNT